MPAFKPKFVVPSSQSAPVSLKEEDQDSHLKKSESEDYQKVNQVSNEIINDQDLQTPENKDFVTLNNVQNVEESSVESEINLIDHYDDVIDSVLEKAAAGTLFVEDRDSSSASNPLVAAQQFNIRTQSISPTNIKSTNEITPNNSPLDETSTPAKLLLQKPTKKKCPIEKPQIHKRKTLDYISSRSSESIVFDEIKNKEKKQKRRKSVSELLTHRRKVLNKGVWVQCSDKKCLKWRYLKNCSDPSSLSEHWLCFMNKDDEKQARCSAPEIDWTSFLTNTEEHFVYTDYNAGSIVWARIAGYPAWPAMVDSDPDTNLFYDYDHDGTVLRYHVVFLDDRVSRAWIPARSVQPYTQQSFNILGHYKVRDFQLELQSAISAANQALELSLEQRLEKFNFEKRYLASGKHKDWASKRVFSKEREKAERNRKSLSVEKQKITGEDKTSSVENKDRVVPECDEKAEKQEKKARKKKDPENKPSHKIKEKLKPDKIKSEFKTPQAKPTPDRGENSSPEAAVVPVSPKKVEKIVDHVTEPDSLKQPITFDPEIYTMEMDESNDEKNPDNMDKNEEDKIMTGDVSVSLSDEANKSLSPPTEMMFEKDFWDVGGVQKVSDDHEDPFCDLMMEDMNEKDWDDERAKELDEFMPVITDDF